MPTMNSMNTPNRTTSPAARLAALTGALALSTLAVTGAVASSVMSAAQPVSAAEASSQDSAQPVTPTNVPGPAGEIGKDGEDPLITFSETAEPMELTALVDFVANTLGINISVRGELRGSVLFNTAKSVRQSQLIPLLDAILEDNDFSITYDPRSEFYQIQPISDLDSEFEGELATTHLIEIPNIKPSSLSDAISQILGGSGQGGSASGVTFIDELGLIVLTNTPRQIARVETLIGRILARTDAFTLTPIELQYISAPTARDRLIALAGGTPSGATGGNNRNLRNLPNTNNNQNNNIGPTAGSTIENIAERLAVDPQSNALLFKGTPDELERVLAYVELIDV